MTERRAHWSGDLIAAVRSEIARARIYNPLDGEVYAVIAAVEDWHKAKRDSRVRTHSTECWRWHQECAEHMIEQQQSIIQRVRELCQSAIDESYLSDASIARAAMANRILRALDGAG